MSVVSNDWRDPAGWAPSKVGVGIVRDGDQLRIARAVKSGKVETTVCTLQEWKDGADCRLRVERDVKAGARVAAGLQAHRLLLRSLESPLTDAAKSSEIWGGLLDAAIPFPLESCLVVFLKPHFRPEGGLRCLAVAAREQDVRDALEEWADIGIDPDMLLPEPLLLPRMSGCPIWMGVNRAVFVAWDGEHFLGASATVKRDQRELNLKRFQQVWKESYPDKTWVSMGPEGSSGPSDVLETALCRACFDSSPTHANLRAGPLAAEGLQSIHQKHLKVLKGSVLVLMLMLVSWPLGIRFQLRRVHHQLQREISTTFAQLTGGAISPQRQQEVLLAQRFLENEWTETRGLGSRLLSPEVSDGFARVARLVTERDLILTRVHRTPERVELNVLGEEEQTKSLVKALGSELAWTVTYAPEANGTWRISGSTRP